MSPRVIIIGGGIMGLSSAWSLSKAGCQVTLFEQGTLPHERGSSVDQHRLIRHAYGAEEGYTRMINDAYAAWEELWRDLGQRYYHSTGTFVGVSEGQTWAQDSLRTLEKLSIPVERLDHRAMQQRWPYLKTDDFEEAFFLASGGALFTRPLLASLTRHLWNMGVDIHQKSQVIDVDLERAVVHLGNGYSDEADAIIVAAGPWVTKLLPMT